MTKVEGCQRLLKGASLRRQQSYGNVRLAGIVASHISHIITTMVVMMVMLMLRRLLFVMSVHHAGANLCEAC